MALEEATLPVRPPVAGVPPEEGDAALAALHAHPLGCDAVWIGVIRIVDMLVGDPLARIC